MESRDKFRDDHATSGLGHLDFLGNDIPLPGFRSDVKLLNPAKVESFLQRGYKGRQKAADFKNKRYCSWRYCRSSRDTLETKYCVMTQQCWSTYSWTYVKCILGPPFMAITWLFSRHVA